MIKNYVLRLSESIIQTFQLGNYCNSIQVKTGGMQGNTCNINRIPEKNRALLKIVGQFCLLYFCTLVFDIYCRLIYCMSFFVFFGLLLLCFE